MALTGGTQWEIRADGDETNGGGFYDRDPGTSVDYCQQAAAQLSLSDLTTDGAGTGLGSVTGGFTAAMVGNIIRIVSGLTVGWYEIVAYTSTNLVTIDRSAGLSGSGGVGKVGGAFAFGTSLDDDFFEKNTAPDVVWIRAGTHTTGETIFIAKDGSTSLGKFRILGYNSSRADNPMGNDRPLINLPSSRYFTSDNVFTIAHLRFEGNNTGFILGCDSTGLIFNCEVVQNNTGAGDGIKLGGSAMVVCCDVTAAGSTGRAISCESLNTGVYQSRVTGSIGIYDPTESNVSGCVIENCDVGIDELTTTSNIFGNTFHNCTVAISCDSNTFSGVIANNIFDSCATGIDSDSNNLVCSLFNNVYDCSSNDTVNIDQTVLDFEQGKVTGDPALTNPEASVMTLTGGSNAEGAGLSVGDYCNTTV